LIKTVRKTRCSCPTSQIIVSTLPVLAAGEIVGFRRLTAPCGGAAPPALSLASRHLRRSKLRRDHWNAPRIGKRLSAPPTIPAIRRLQPDASGTGPLLPEFPGVMRL